MGDSSSHDDATREEPAYERRDATDPIETSARASVGPRSSIPSMPIVPGYDVLRVIGRGGMGTVWEAIEHRLERKVALKVHAGSTPERVEQLWVEAKLAAKIGHPHIVSIHDVGRTLDGRPYYTMDFVEGTALRALIRDGALPEARALELAAEIADAVAAAHAAGVVHCDLKPANVLVDEGGRVRVLDFGLAVRVDAMKPTREVRGSPPYMAPEQVLAEPPTPACDVYAIGVILYEMLSGKLPLSADTTEDLLLAVARVPPPPLREIAPTVRRDIELVVMRCLEKRREKRFESAAILRDVLRALVNGRDIEELTRSSYTPRPKKETPPIAPARLARDVAERHYRWAWTFDAPPSRVWPFVANTDRFNKAIGLPTVEIADAPDPRASLVREARMRSFGMKLLWDEHPFEWIRHREHSVFREYKVGPLRALWNRVELKPLADEKTELVHEIWVKPSGILGRFATLIEIQLRAARRMDAFYRRLADVLAKPEGEDAFERAAAPDTETRERVARITSHLVGERGFPQTLVDNLAKLVLHAPTKRLERIRPFEMASQWGARRDEVLDLFLHAANAGLLDLGWDLLCPECQVPHEAHGSLAGVTRNGACGACGSTYERDLAGSIELVFRPAASLREVRPATYCAGAPALRPHVLMQQILEPGEARTVALELPVGDYRFATARGERPREIASTGAGIAREGTVTLSSELDVRPIVVAAGEVRFTLINARASTEVVRLETAGAARDDVTAAMALAHPSFQRFFSADVLARGEHLTVGRMAFVLVDVANLAHLLEERGDGGALAVASTVEETVLDAANAEHGSLVELDAANGMLVAAFPRAAQAVRAALRALHDGARRVPEAALKICVHEGRCIALTRGKSVQYFGETLERGVAFLAASPTEHVAVTSAITDDPDAAREVFAADVERNVRTVGSGRYAGRRYTAIRRKA